jgi:hypothetical protein
VSEVLSRVGDRWTVLVVGELGNGAKRFNEIRRALGSISQNRAAIEEARKRFDAAAAHGDR